jgi:hypothetical protein
MPDANRQTVQLLRIYLAKRAKRYTRRRDPRANDLKDLVNRTNPTKKIKC